MLSQAAIGSLAIAGAAAFLLPPNVALEQVSTPSTNQFGNLLRDPFSMKISAPCPACPYAEVKDGKLVWTEGINNSLLFQIAAGKDADTLELNGAKIYPVLGPLDLAAGAHLDTPRIPQIPSDISINNIESNPDQYLSHPLTMTAWRLDTTTLHSVAHTGEEIIKLQLSVDALEGQHINMPYDVVITALKNPQVPLMVLNVELQDRQANNCHGLPMLCRLKSMLATMSQRVKGKLPGGCHKGQPHYVSAAEQHKEEDLDMPQRPNHRPHHKVGQMDHPHGERPHHYGHHGQHLHHHAIHRALHTAARVILTVVIPLLLGIMAGILTYTVGMLVGTAIAILWVRFRSRRANYQPIVLDDEESDFVNEK